jgi:hypothetical protein
MVRWMAVNCVASLVIRLLNSIHDIKVYNFTRLNRVTKVGRCFVDYLPLRDVGLIHCRTNLKLTVIDDVLIVSFKEL